MVDGCLSAPICKNDEYVGNCESDNTFITSGSSLLSGCLPCRCSKVYKWSKQEMLYRVKKFLTSRGDSYIGFNEPYKCSKTIINWKAVTCDHINKTSVNKILNGQRCSKCFKGGFNSSTAGILYLVLWKFENNSYIKYGITNKDTRSRCMKHKRGSSESPVFETLYEFYSKDGKEIYSCEKAIKDHFSNFEKCPAYLLPEGYTETVISDESNLSKILQIITTFNLTQSDT